MDEKQKDFVQEFDDMLSGHNIYRTAKYIVSQEVKLIYKGDAQTFVMSEDTFYLRNKQRDKAYEEIFFDRLDQIDGSRLHASAYTRKYVD